MGKKKITLKFLLSIVLGYVLHFPLRLAEDAIMGWLNTLIAERWATMTAVQWLTNNFVDWILPFLLAIGIVWVVYWAASKERGTKQPKQPLPNLEPVDSPYTDKRKIRSVDQTRQLIGEPFFCHVKFRNNPNIHSAEANAPKVYHIMTFYNLDEKQVFQLDKVRPGGIAEPPYQQPSELPQKYYEVEYNANGDPWEVTIALKYEEDDVCYAFDDNSYGSTQWKKPEYLLQGNSFYVKVNLKGENTRGEWWFMLYNHGIGKGIEAEAISQPTFGKAG